MPAMDMMQAFGSGGGAAAPSPFRVPAGIPADMLGQATGGLSALPSQVAPSANIQGLLRSGAISAEQLLAIVAMLAGLGQAPQGAPGQSPDMMEAFMGQGMSDGEAQV
jgi:hypothetical protein